MTVTVLTKTYSEERKTLRYSKPDLKGQSLKKKKKKVLCVTILFCNITEFNILTDNQNDEEKHSLGKFADGPKLEGVPDALESCTAI